MAIAKPSSKINLLNTCENSGWETLLPSGAIDKGIGLSGHLGFQLTWPFEDIGTLVDDDGAPNGCFVISQRQPGLKTTWILCFKLSWNCQHCSPTSDVRTQNALTWSDFMGGQKVSLVYNPEFNVKNIFWGNFENQSSPRIWKWPKQLIMVSKVFWTLYC